LLASGNTIAVSLELCKAISESSGEKIAELCDYILEGIRKGEQFSGCLLRCKNSFPPLYTALVGIGEKTGCTADVFKQLSSYLATVKNIKTKIEGSLFYPLFVLASALLGTILILLFVMPRMAEIFSVFNTGESSIDMGGMYTSVYTILAVLLSIFVLTIFLILLHRYSWKTALVIDKLLLHMPFVGSFLSSMESLDFCFAMEMCSKTGMNAALSLEEAKKVVHNRAYAQAVIEVKDAVMAGENMSQAFLTKSVFPPIIGQWIAVGEKTGEANMVFSHLKGFFKEIVDSYLVRFLNALEPALMLATGLVVLFLVLQFVLPLFSLYGAIL
jgi:type II secretory pathway component PulF